MHFHTEDFMSSNTFKHTAKAVAVLLGAALMAGHAQATSLADLISGGGTITVGDKVFSSFAYTASGFDNHAVGIGSTWANTTAAYLAQAALIDVNGITVAGNYGLAFLGEWHAHPGNSAAAQITYTVTSLGGYITDFHLDGAPKAIGTSSAEVTESVLTPVTHEPIPTLPPSLLAIYDLGNEVVDFSDSSDVVGGASAKLKSVLVQTDIRVAAMTGVGNYGQVTHIEETFSQAVPEPSTYGMALSGLAMMGLITRRKKRN